MPAVAEKPKRAKNERFDIRVPSATKSLITEAASIKGMNASDFIASAAYDEAQRTILGHEIMQLNPEQSRRVIESLRSPSEPNETLKNLLGKR